jgi:hypothetical protein
LLRGERLASPATFIDDEDASLVSVDDDAFSEASQVSLSSVSGVAAAIAAPFPVSPPPNTEAYSLTPDQLFRRQTVLQETELRDAVFARVREIAAKSAREAQTGILRRATLSTVRSTIDKFGDNAGVAHHRDRSALTGESYLYGFGAYKPDQMSVLLTPVDARALRAYRHLVKSGEILEDDALDATDDDNASADVFNAQIVPAQLLGFDLPDAAFLDPKYPGVADDSDASESEEFDVQIGVVAEGSKPLPATIVPVPRSSPRPMLDGAAEEAAATTQVLDIGPSGPVVSKFGTRNYTLNPAETSPLRIAAALAQPLMASLTVPGRPPTKFTLPPDESLSSFSTPVPLHALRFFPYRCHLSHDML